MMTVEEKLLTVRFRTDEQAPIRIDTHKCADCPEKACVSVCPAERYRCSPSGVEYSAVGCLECGACQVVCDRKAIAWNYPQGGLGVALRYG